MSLPGTLYIVSAASGTGKTSLVNALVAQEPNLAISVSHTTRAPRKGEIEGREYHFVDTAAFKKLITDKAFLEYAEVFGDYYGTSLQSVEKPLSQGKDMILEIDWQGARQIRQLIPNNVSVFILPPSKKALYDRLQARGQDSVAVVENRMNLSEQELSHYYEYDYLVINDNFNHALQELSAILQAQRLRTQRQMQIYRNLIQELLSK